jgi:hypothetical protein
MEKIEEYLRRAAEAEKLVETATTEHDRRHYLQLAISYRALAERREAIIRAGNVPPAPRAR